MKHFAKMTLCAIAVLAFAPVCWAGKASDAVRAASNVYVYIALENPSDETFFFPRKVEKGLVMERVYHPAGYKVNSAGKHVFPGGRAYLVRGDDSTVWKHARQDALREWHEETGIADLEEFADAIEHEDYVGRAHKGDKQFAYFIFRYKLKADRADTFVAQLHENFADFARALQGAQEGERGVDFPIADQELDGRYLNFMSLAEIVSTTSGDAELDWFFRYARHALGEEDPALEEGDELKQTCEKPALGPLRPSRSEDELARFRPQFERFSASMRRVSFNEGSRAKAAPLDPIAVPDSDEEDMPAAYRSERSASASANSKASPSSPWGTPSSRSSASCWRTPGTGSSSPASENLNWRASPASSSPASAVVPAEEIWSVVSSKKERSQEKKTLNARPSSRAPRPSSAL